MSRNHVGGRMFHGALVAVLVVATSGCAFLARVSTSQGPVGSLGALGRPALSGDGRYAAYATQADSAVPGGTDMIVRRDHQTAAVVRVDVNSAEQPGDGSATEPAISGDGRYVAFASDAENLVANDENVASDIFVRDVVNGTTERVSVASDGAEADSDSYGPSISADGRYVAFTSDADITPDDANGSSDVFVHDRVTHATTLASVATNGTQAEFGAWNGEISANGGHVVFTTDTGLATGDDNETDDVYIRNLGLGQTRRVSVMLAGGDLGAVSADGRYVAFSGGDGNVYLRDTVALTTRRVNANTTAPGFFPAISGDGRWVAFLSPGNASGTDANGVRWDVFLRDTVANVTTVGSTKLFLEQIDADSWNPALSQDGRYVGWISAGRFVDDDTNGLNDVFVRAVPVPKITSVTPATVTRGTNPTLTVSGTGFIAPIVAAVNLGNDGVSVTNVTVVNGTTLTLNLSVASNAKLGKQDVDVLNAGTGMGLFQGGGARCGGCLTVK